MKAVILDGSRADDGSGRRVSAVLMAQLNSQGWDVEHTILCEQKIGNCAGDFFCWVRTPGVCNVNDDNRAIAEALANSDLMIYLTPVTFGGYSSVLKRMVDHQIQNVSPFFKKVEGETHHHVRYKENPDLLVVGWTESHDAESEAVFRHLVQRNAINFHAKTCVSDVVLVGESDEDLQASAQKWLAKFQSNQSSRRVELPANRVTGNGATEIRRALLLVGSPKTRKSTSNSLGGFLFEQLGVQPIQTETIYLHTVLRNPQKMQALLDAVDVADLVTLAFPIYVDTLPAPVIEAFERIAAHRQEHRPAHRQLFTAIANCGFPEAHHCLTALAICQTFACQAGFEWAGALALGGGQMLNGTPLAEGGGQTMRIRQSLQLAAEALAQGGVIPQAAQDMMASPVIPHWAYRLLGGIGWIQAAKGYGAIWRLRRQPYSS